MIDKRCETCVQWTRDEKRSALDRWWGICDTLGITDDRVYIDTCGGRKTGTRDTFSCPAHFDKPAGPFSVHTNEGGKRFLKYDAGDGERFSRILHVLGLWRLERLAESLNELWAEREAQ